MENDDKSGTPLWMPKVLKGDNEKPEAKEALTAGTRLLWHLNGESKDTDTEFEILTGEGEVAFKVIGTLDDAGAVVDAFRLKERVERNAMRLFLDMVVKKGADISKDPTLASFDKAEKDKLHMFNSFLAMLGMALINSGARPWDGKVGSAEDGSKTEAVAFSIVKGEGGSGGDQTSN